jgi:hypothetical protein
MHMLHRNTLQHFGYQVLIVARYFFIINDDVS